MTTSASETAEAPDVTYSSVIDKLTKDLKNATITLSPGEVRFLVDYFYQIQDDRKRFKNQVRALAADNEPHVLLGWMGTNFEILESNLKLALQAYARSQHMGKWAMEVKGIGPIIAAGLMAYIRIEKAPHVSHVYNFAGLAPGQKWLGQEGAKDLLKELGFEGRAKITQEDVFRVANYIKRQPESLLKMVTRNGERPINKTNLTNALALRPWSGSFKTLCWKIGESFQKVCNKDDAQYGKLYLERRMKEEAKNLKGDYADQAKRQAEKVGKTTDAYVWYSGQVAEAAAQKYYFAESGKRPKIQDLVAENPGEGIHMLPPKHIIERSKRWAVKIFLSHWHGEAYRQHHGEEPPKFYSHAHLDHVDEISPEGHN